MRVRRSPDVLEPDMADFASELPGPLVQRAESGVFHPVMAKHLLDEEQRVRSDEHALMAARAPIRGRR
jgi:hypothetical protein